MFVGVYAREDSLRAVSVLPSPWGPAGVMSGCTLSVHVCARLLRSAAVTPPRASSCSVHSRDVTHTPGNQPTDAGWKWIKTTTAAVKILKPTFSVFWLQNNSSDRITAAEPHLRILINFRRPFICCEEAISHDNNCRE